MIGAPVARELLNQRQWDGHGEVRERGMEYCKIMAYVTEMRLEHVERALMDAGVKGISVSWVKGYGEYKNFFSRDLLCCSHAKIEVFALREDTDAIVDLIMKNANTGGPSSGLVAVQPVEKIFRVRTGERVRPELLELPRPAP